MWPVGIRVSLISTKEFSVAQGDSDHVLVELTNFNNNSCFVPFRGVWSVLIWNTNTITNCYSTWVVWADSLSASQDGLVWSHKLVTQRYSLLVTSLCPCQVCCNTGEWCIEMSQYQGSHRGWCCHTMIILFMIFTPISTLLLLCGNVTDERQWWTPQLRRNVDEAVDVNYATSWDESSLLVPNVVNVCLRLDMRRLDPPYALSTIGQLLYLSTITKQLCPT